MVSRRYITNTAPTYTPATIRGAWNQTSDEFFTPAIKALSITPSGTPVATGTEEFSSIGNWDVLLGRWVSEPVAGGSLSGTVTWVIACTESANTMNAFFHVHIYATAGSSDALRATVLTDAIGATEFPTTTTARSEGAIAISTAALTPGDRIVVEIGYQAQNTTASERSAEIFRGGSYTTDLVVGNGASEITEGRPGWFEFSDPNNVLAVLTSQTWYAHYDTTTGELLSLGTVYPDPVPSGTNILVLNEQPNQLLYIWDTITRTFIPRDPDTLFDRVEDLVVDSSLSSVWSTLDATQDQALKDRVSQLLGPYRYRLSFQPVDLEEGQPEK